MIDAEKKMKEKTIYILKELKYNLTEVNCYVIIVWN